MFQVGKRRLGRDGPEVSAIGLGCMGMSEFYGGGKRGRNRSRPSTMRSTAGVTFLDTADMYGVGKQRGAGRPRDPRPPRPGVPRHQVRQRPRPERRVPRRPRRPGLCPLGLRSEPQAARRRGHRPLLPAPRRPERADRGYGRRNGPAQGRGEGPLSRPVRSRAADDPRGACDARRSPRSRPSCRCGAATPRPRCCRRCASSASALSLIRRSAAGS